LESKVRGREGGASTSRRAETGIVAETVVVDLAGPALGAETASFRI
jgi:hypothetical protein